MSGSDPKALKTHTAICNNGLTKTEKETCLVTKRNSFQSDATDLTHRFSFTHETFLSHVLVYTRSIRSEMASDKEET